MAISKHLAPPRCDGQAERERDLRWHGRLIVVLTCVMPPLLSGCLATASYPRDWPAPTKELVGKCPSIAGKFRNVGKGHPEAAGSLLLTGLLDLPEGEQVEITQSPATIEVAVWNNGKRFEEVTFTSVWLDPWADTIQPRTFQCPIDIGPPSGRLLLFSHLVSQVFGIGFRNVSFTKTADGSLIVTDADLDGRVYYRFERVDQ